MAKRIKYTDTELIKGIERGLEDGGIMDRLCIPVGSRGGVKKRLEKLREKHGTLEVHIPEANGINYGKAKAAELVEQNRVDVESIMKGIEDKNQALKGKTVEDLFQRKPATINQEFEEAVNAMVRENTVKQLENLKDHCEDMEDETEPDNVWQDDVKALDMAIKTLNDEVDPAYSVDVLASNFIRQAKLSFKGDMDRYTSYASKLSEKMVCGEIIDLVDVTEYNKVVGKYSGGSV